MDYPLGENLCNLSLLQLNIQPEEVSADDLLPVIQIICEELLLFQPLDLSSWKLIMSGKILSRATVKQLSLPLISDPLKLLERLLKDKEFALIKLILNDIKSMILTNCCELCPVVGESDFENFHEYHQDLPYSQDCVNKLLLFFSEYALKIDTTIRGSRKSIGTGVGLIKSPPLKSDWIPDEATEICMCCKSLRFTTMRRKHHCRACGRVVCKLCSRRKRRIANFYNNRPVRHCDECFDNLSLAAVPVTDSDWSERSPLVSATICLESIVGETTNDPLNPTDGVNGSPSQSCYNTAPDAELCLGILDLCSDNQLRNKFLMSQCNRFEGAIQRATRHSQQIPDAKRFVNVLMCLAWAAKVRGAAQSNWTVAKAQILKKMSNLDLLHLVPTEKLINGESFKRLRDNLLTAGMFSLAMDVSLLCGLSSKSVQMAWGIQCLKQGNYYMAREKLSQGARVVPISVAEKVAEELIDGNYSEDIMSKTVTRPKETPDAVNEILKVLEDKFDVEWEQESYYYLFLYGSHRSILSFLIRNRPWSFGFRYILDQSVDFEDFLEGVILNASTEVTDFDLVVLMRGSNPSLEKWEPYLRKLCQLYERKNILANLYNIQAALGDDIRAALTCLKFFSNNCSNYKCFVEHLHYLENAEFHFKRDLKKQHHLQYQYLPNRKSCRMFLDQPIIQTHLRSISVQKKIARFLAGFEGSEENGRNLLEVVERSSEGRIDTPITIFDKRHHNHLMFLLVSCDIDRGYDLIWEIFDCFPSTDRRDIFQFIVDQFALSDDSIDKMISFTKTIRKRALMGSLIDKCIYQALSRVVTPERHRKFMKVIWTIENVHLR